MPRKRLPTGVRRSGAKYRADIPTGTRGKSQYIGTFDTAEEAEHARAEALKFITPNRAGYAWKTVVDCCRADLELRCRPATVEWFAGQMRALTKTLEELGHAEHKAFILLDTDVWRDVQRKRLAEVTASSVANHWRALQMLYRWAIDNNVAVRSPLRKVPTPPVRPREMDYLEEPEFWDLIDAMERHHHPHGPVDVAIFCVLFLTGLRRSELVRMQVGEVDVVRREAWVTGKRRDERLPIARAAVPYFERLIDGRTRGPLLLGGDGRLRRAFQRWKGGRTRKDPESGENYREETPLGGEFRHITARLHPHALRHSFVTALIRAVGDKVQSDKELLQLTRLRSIATLHRYLHVRPDPSLVDELGKRRAGAAAPLRVVREQQPPA